MCEKKRNLIFCSCSDKTESDKMRLKTESFKTLGDKAEYHSTYYSWSLSRLAYKYTEKERSRILGQLILPAKKIDDEITAKFVVSELNSGAEFDFNYIPKYGDELCIRLRYRYVEIEKHPRPSIFGKFMSFVFEDGEWYFGYIDHFEYRQREVGKGEVNSVNKQL